MSARIGDWFQTFTGRKFYPMDPRPEDIDIADIAHALSNVCRFGGHCTAFYSVAQHSVLVSGIVKDPQLRFKGLMHDATEAYLGDMIRPIKRQMADYQRAEAKMWDAICHRFGIDPLLPSEIKEADNIALSTERRDLIVSAGHKFATSEQYPPVDGVKIIPNEPRIARAYFLTRFTELTEVAA